MEQPVVHMQIQNYSERLSIHVCTMISRMPLDKVPVDESAFKSLVAMSLTTTLGEPEYSKIPLRERIFGDHQPDVAMSGSNAQNGVSESKDADEDTGGTIAEDACRKKYGFAHPALSQLARSWLHIYGKDGNHCGWTNVEEWHAMVTDKLGFDMGRSTAYRWAAAEKKLQESGQRDAKGRTAMSNKNDASFLKIMADFEAAKRDHDAIKEEPRECVQFKVMDLIVFSPLFFSHFPAASVKNSVRSGMPN